MTDHFLPDANEEGNGISRIAFRGVAEVYCSILREVQSPDRLTILVLKIVLKAGALSLSHKRKLNGSILGFDCRNKLLP